ncbi:MAG: hypothetical protein HC866_13285 [Leptolyngbyaceae cyanobacterium RU_5_1]|nr:hypothetical protein [Leptolyngbyaceae cyanobacterium RU_5_1]
MLRVIWAIALALLLTACGPSAPEPTTQLVEQAIALQLNQAQQELSQQLRLDSPPTDIRVSRIKITQQTPLTIQNLQSYHIKGTCDFTVKRPKHSVTQHQTPFEVYLQRQMEGKTWRLASLKTNEDHQSVWVTQRIPSSQFPDPSS